MKSYCALIAKLPQRGSIFSIESALSSRGYKAHTLLGLYDVIVLLEGKFEQILEDRCNIVKSNLVGSLVLYTVTNEYGSPFSDNPRAYVFTNTVPGSESDVMQKLLEIDGVVSSSEVSGPFSLISEVVANSLNELASVNNNMRVDGVVNNVMQVCAVKD